GQRAWAAAEKLSRFWSGSISLIAAGDPNFMRKRG
ncbi:MAG: HesA/MoeB/ThiF family protein, partial [Alphaproteobacteria bacterium]|nr:HesA/MoeB/ThiF family protein [Alphaproteobacteria bacterium]